LPTAAQRGRQRAQTNREDEVRNYEIAKKTTRTVAHGPRIVRLSAAVVVDGVDGKPRPAEEVRRLAELAKRAMGFETQRGDTLEISSAAFAKVEEADVKAPSGNARVLAPGQLVGWGRSGPRRSVVYGPLFRRTSSAMALLQPGTRWAMSTWP